MTHKERLPKVSQAVQIHKEECQYCKKILQISFSDGIKIGIGIIISITYKSPWFSAKVSTSEKSSKRDDETLAASPLWDLVLIVAALKKKAATFQTEYVGYLSRPAYNFSFPDFSSHLCCQNYYSSWLLSYLTNDQFWSSEHKIVFIDPFLFQPEQTNLISRSQKRGKEKATKLNSIWPNPLIILNKLWYWEFQQKAKWKKDRIQNCHL